MVVFDCLDGLIAGSVSGERIRAANGKRIRAAGVYGSKKEYRSGLFLGRYFFCSMHWQKPESRNTDITT